MKKTVYSIVLDKSHEGSNRRLILARRSEGLENIMPPKIKIVRANYDGVALTAEMLNSRKSPDWLYFTSNERYPKSILARIGDVRAESYLGICGGGTQNLSLLNILMAKNEFEYIAIIDKVRYQLLNFSNIADISSASADDKDYRKRLHEMLAKVKRNTIYYQRYPNWINDLNIEAAHRLNISRDITIHTAVANLDEYVARRRKGRRSFLYLSNVLFDKLGLADSERVLKNITENDSFKNGSTIFLVNSMVGTGGRMLRKERGKIVVEEGDTEYYLNFEKHNCIRLKNTISPAGWYVEEHHELRRIRR